jgi:hypothetical protein
LDKLAALVPPLRAQLTRFDRVLPPNAKIRSKVVPNKKEQETKQDPLAHKVLFKGTYSSLEARKFREFKALKPLYSSYPPFFKLFSPGGF